MSLNIALAIAELLALGVIMLLLHRISLRYGLVFLFVYLGSLTAILQFSSPLGIFIRPSTELILFIGSDVLIPVILFGVLIIYVVDGTIPARFTIIGIVGVTLVVQVVLFTFNLHIVLPTGGSLAEIPANSPVLLADLRTLFASVTAFVLDLFTIIFVYQLIKNRVPYLPNWLVPALALVVSLWVDALAFQLLAAESIDIFYRQFPGQWVGKSFGALLLSPVAVIYLEWIIPRTGQQKMPAFRPSYDILFGSMAQLENLLSQTEAQLRRRQDEQRALDATLLDITASSNLEDLLKTIVSRAVKLLDGTGGGLYLCEPHDQEVRCIVSYNTKTDFSGVRLVYGEGAAGVVAQTGKPLIINNYAEWDRRASVYELAKPFRSVLSVPLLWVDEVLGVIHVFDNKQIGRFVDADLNLLMAFANHAAVAVNNARTLQAAEQRVEESERLRQAGAIVAATLEPQEAIQRILDQLENVMVFDSACVMLLEGDSSLQIVGGRGWQDPEQVIGLTFPIPGNNPNTEVIRSQSAVILEDAPQEYKAFREQPHSHVRSWLGVPLVFRNQVIGMLAMDHCSPRFYSPDHARLASAFANYVAVAIGNARLYALENQRVQEMDNLRATMVDLSANLTLSSLLENILKQAVSLVGGSGGDLGLYNPQEKTIRIVISHNLEKDYTNTVMRQDEGAMGYALTHKEAIIIPNYTEWSNRSSQFDETSLHGVMAAPLLWEGSRVGAIAVVANHREHHFTAADKQILLKFAEQAAITINNARQFEKALGQAMTDSLTGLYNRRAFDRDLRREIARASRSGLPVSLAILDIDNFKAYNDTYGHPAGDEQLRILASVLERNIRVADLAARYGGEEFAIILPQCKKADALHLLERIRIAAQETAPSQVARSDPMPGYTVSIGVATYPEDADNAEDLLRSADSAELEAKRQGKNRVVAANGQSLESKKQN